AVRAGPDRPRRPDRRRRPPPAEWMTGLTPGGWGLGTRPRSVKAAPPGSRAETPTTRRPQGGGPNFLEPLGTTSRFFRNWGARRPTPSRWALRRPPRPPAAARQGPARPERTGPPHGEEATDRGESADGAPESGAVGR